VFGVIPRECEATVFGPSPISFEYVLLTENAHQVFDVGLVGILDAKVINHKGKFDGTGGVLPKTWGDGAGSIAMGLQELGKSFVGDDACLWETVHPFLNAYVTMSVFD
jgi:hypothetical protein